MWNDNHTRQLLINWIWGLALSLVLTGIDHSVLAQNSTIAPPAQPSLTPPVPLESGPVQAFPSTSPLAPSLSIGPAPGIFPAPAYRFNGRPGFIGPPFPGPMLGPPVLVGNLGLGPTPLAGPGPAPFLSKYGSPTSSQTQGTLRPLVDAHQSAGPANFRLAVSEAFLNRAIAREEIQPGPVRDVILGAQVTGRQTTSSRLRLDLIPSPVQAHVRFVLNGDVQTLTTGVTPQAMIDTAGQQQFVGMKDVFFDGLKFSTRHATVFIRANNQTVGATTPLSGTVFGSFADRIAYRAAERRKAAGEAVTRDRLAEKLFPTFDGEVDAQLGQANRQLDSVVRRGLEAVKLMPTTQSVWTTDTHLYHEGFIGSEEIRSSIPQPIESVDGQNGLRIIVHESLLNTFVDRAGLKGYKTTDKELRALEDPYAVHTSDAAANSADPDADKQPTTFAPPAVSADAGKFVTDIVFDDVEPLTLRLDGDRLMVTIKAAFKPGGQSLVPAMAIAIPYQITLTGDKIRLTAGKPRVTTQDRPDPDAPQTIIETAIERLIQAELVPLEFDRKLPAAYWPASGPPPQITSIKSENGWATIAIE